MSRDTIEKYSKEFQIKIRRSIGEGSDARCFEELSKALREIESEPRFNFRITNLALISWKRRGERYDILPGTELFRRNNISLATEKGEKNGKKKTKLKCKMHNLVPELLYEKRDKSLCYPSAGKFRKDKDVELKFKLEQDIHFNNTKYCATGYLQIPGRKHKFKKVNDFLPYYPRLEKLSGVRKGIKLVKVKDWQETVFDDMEFRIGNWKIEGALVTRRETGSGKWDESEFSFKVRPPKKKAGNKNRRCRECLDPAATWDYGKLRELEDIYIALSRKSSLFIQDPSIFYFSNPVKSVDI